MKNLKEFILEKFKINSKTVFKKSNNKVVNKLCELFPINDSLKDLIKVFEEWVNKYDIKDVIPIAYPSSLEKYENSKEFTLSEEVLKLYQKQNSPDNCDECEALIEEASEWYRHPWDAYRIYASENIIAFNPNGQTKLDNLYCIPEK